MLLIFDFQANDYLTLWKNQFSIFFLSSLSQKKFYLSDWRLFIAIYIRCKKGEIEKLR